MQSPLGSHPCSQVLPLIEQSSQLQSDQPHSRIDDGPICPQTRPCLPIVSINRPLLAQAGCCIDFVNLKKGRTPSATYRCIAMQKNTPHLLARTDPQASTDMLNPWRYSVVWEQCERRLALSAMPWMPLDFGPQLSPSVDSNQSLHQSDLFDVGSSSDSQSSPAIEEHLSEAHAQSGWNQVHSQYGLSGKGQTVAVIDSGIAFDHVALGKGYGPGYKVVGGWDFAENDAKPYDDAPAGFHGTHVAGIIGANDGVHFGVAPDVDLVALRVFNDSGKGELSWAESALQWVHTNRSAFANPITTVNLSLGAAWNSSTVPTWATLEEELGQLQRDGIVVVVSAGNAFQQNKTPGLSYPAASPFVIPVSSVDANGQLSDFSQRDSRSIAAPGRAIESTVPDYFYGKDGINNDWATASGTSQAAPYIAGASVLVREAMELAGFKNITPESIYEHLRSTANDVWDSITQQNYRSLDLDRAIESLIPVDGVGNSWANAQTHPVQDKWQTDGWVNSLSDSDVYRLNPNQSGNVSLQLTSEYVQDAALSLIRDGQETTIHADHGRLSFAVRAGEAIGIRVADQDSIGPYRIDWAFAPSTIAQDSPSTTVQLGKVDSLSQTFAGTSKYAFTADHTGILSVIVDAGSSTTGALQVLRPSMANGTLTDTSIENNQWRIDLNVVEGLAVELVLPGTASRNVHIANLVQQQGSKLTVFGTEKADQFSVDLRNGLSIEIDGVAYQFEAGAIKSVVIDGALNNDSLNLTGSAQAEKIEMHPGLVTLSNSTIDLEARDVENVKFIGGGGPDRAYLYDAATDDRLNVWPNKSELTGVGYAFNVEQIERVFVHAVLGGDDQAFVFDSVGDDTLSVRPQFTSISGDGFFNYISGFERVFAYANGGGTDTALLYDSAGDDLFGSNGETTSIVGAGFSTFARGFEKVEAYANAGGLDRANIYASTSGRLTGGVDFIGMEEGNRSSIARNFEKISTFVAGQSVPIPTSILSMSAEGESKGDTTLMDPNEGKDRLDLDLSWLDVDQERAALDHLFSIV
jgi:subtilisin family serine protease